MVLATILARNVFNNPAQLWCLLFSTFVLFVSLFLFIYIMKISKIKSPWNVILRSKFFSCLRSRIYGTIGKKRRSQLLFNADFYKCTLTNHDAHHIFTVYFEWRDGWGGREKDGEMNRLLLVKTNDKIVVCQVVKRQTRNHSFRSFSEAQAGFFAFSS